MGFKKMNTTLSECEFFPGALSYSVTGCRKWIDYSGDLSWVFCQRALVEW